MKHPKFRFEFSLVFPALLALLFACHGSKNDFSYIFKFTGITIEHGENLGALPQTTSMDSIPASAYVIRVNLFSEILAEGKAGPDQDHPVECENSIASLSITSNVDFGTNYPAGTSLNDLFIYFNSSYFNTWTLNDFTVTNAQNSDYAKNPIPQKMDLLLMNPPPLPVNCKFTVAISTYDGTIYTDSTTMIKLYE